MRLSTGPNRTGAHGRRARSSSAIREAAASKAGFVHCVLATVVLPLMQGSSSERPAAAPAIIIVHGRLLPDRVVMSDWQENHRFVSAIDLSTRVDGDVLDDRPFVALSLFWGPEWSHHPRTPEALARLRPEQANQHGRFYPAREDTSARVLMGPAIGREYSTVGRSPRMAWPFWFAIECLCASSVGAIPRDQRLQLAAPA
jgi:hypothetical protein